MEHTSPPSPSQWDTGLHRLFQVSVLGKAVDGLLEILGGGFLLFIRPSQLGWLATVITRRELLEDPSDFVANIFLRTATGVTPHNQFVSVLFLLSHGLFKVFLAWALLRGKRWAYPLTIVVFLFFIASQTAELLRHPSALLVGITLLDLLIVLLAWREGRGRG